MRMGWKTEWKAADGLERSRGSLPGDRMRDAPAQPAVQWLDAHFAGHAYDLHRHDTYAIGYTLGGVQSCNYRGARAGSTHGCAIVLHPGERHDGCAGSTRCVTVSGRVNGRPKQRPLADLPARATSPASSITPMACRADAGIH
jgi:hypothetical protein